MRWLQVSDDVPSIQPVGGHMGDKKKTKWGCRKAVN
jgi:hypothetical protein